MPETCSSVATGPLQGLKIIEMEGIGPGPLAGQLMADLGAEVVVIARNPELPAVSEVNARNKTWLPLNLKDPRDLDRARALIARADLLIEGYRPGVMERLGLGPADCHALNSGLIFGRMTGWGQQGPMAHTAGHDLTYLATTGALSLMGQRGQPPAPPLNLVADYGGGTMFLIFGLLSALWERNRTGLGQVVDAAMVDGVSAMMAIWWSMRETGQWLPQRQSNLIDGGAPWYGVYATSDSKYIAIGAIEPQFFAEFAALADLPQTLIDRRDDRPDWPRQRALYAALFAGRSRDDWAALFAGSDACVAPVLSPDEAAASDHSRARGAYVSLAGMLQPAPAPGFSRHRQTPLQLVRKAPADTEIFAGG